MTILQAIDDACKCAKIRTPIFADIRTFQSFADSFVFEDNEYNVIVPFENNGSWEGPRRTAIVPIKGWLVRRIPEDTNDWRHRKVETDYLEPMRAKAKVFLQELINSDVVDPEVKKISDSIKPEYMFLNQHLFGVSYTVNLPVTETVC